MSSPGRAAARPRHGTAPGRDPGVACGGGASGRDRRPGRANGSSSSPSDVPSRIPATSASRSARPPASSTRAATAAASSPPLSSRLGTKPRRVCLVPPDLVFFTRAGEWIGDRDSGPESRLSAVSAYEMSSSGGRGLPVACHPGRLRGPVMALFPRLQQCRVPVWCWFLPAVFRSGVFTGVNVAIMLQIPAALAEVGGIVGLVQGAAAGYAWARHRKRSRRRYRGRHAARVGSRRGMSCMVSRGEWPALVCAVDGAARMAGASAP